MSYFYFEYSWCLISKDFLGFEEVKSVEMRLMWGNKFLFGLEIREKRRENNKRG